MKRLLAFFAAWTLIFAFVFIVCKAVVTVASNLFDLPKTNICGDNSFIENYSIKNKNNKKKILKLAEKTVQDCKKSVEDTSFFYNDPKTTKDDPCAMALVQLGISTLYYLDIQEKKDKDIAKKELGDTLEYFERGKICKIEKEDNRPEVFIVKKSLEHALMQSSK